MKDVFALVLAGGVDPDLPVLTDVRATTSLPFGGRYRVIDFPLSNCVHSEIYRVGILAQYNPESLLTHLGIGRFWDLDRKEGGLRVLQPFQRQEGTDWYRGTADAIRQNLEEVRNSGARIVVVLSGDVVTKMDLAPIIESHRQSGSPVTLVAGPVSGERLRRFGEIVPGSGGRIEGFSEKPAHGRPGLAFTGVYVFDETFLVALLHDDSHGLNLVLDYVVPLVSRAEVPVHFHEFEGYWEDIGSVRSYYHANLDLIGPDPALDLSDPEWPIYTRSEERGPVFLGPAAEVSESRIAHGCVVSGTVSRSILFGGVVVEAGAHVADSILMNDTIVEKGAQISSAIADKNVRVSEGAVVGGDRPSGSSDGITILGKHAVLPKGVRVARGAIVGVDVGPEDFERESIPSGTYIRRRAG